MNMSTTAFPKLPCISASLRRASRALTQVYEQGLRSHGLRASQFTILQVLALAGEVTQGHLGKMLAMDSTTLTRTLSIMARHGWIAERRGKDKRQRRWRLAAAGEARLKRAAPAWAKAQSWLRQQLGGEAWETLFQLTNQVAEIAVTKGDSL